MTDTFKRALQVLLKKHRAEMQLPLSRDEIKERLSLLKINCPQLFALYEVTNGLQKEWFRILPLKDNQRIKVTWDCVERANDPQTCRYLGGNKELLHRFFVFSDIGGGRCGCIDRTTGAIWYEDEQLNETDLDVLKFVEIELREVDEL